MKCGFVALCAWTFFVILRLFPAYYYDSARSTITGEAPDTVRFAPVKLRLNALCLVATRKQLSHLALVLRGTPPSRVLISWTLLTSGDIETNPGPSRRWKYPCTVCSAPVKSNQRGGIQCDRCDLWTHASCGGVGQEEYEELYGDWFCPTCELSDLPFANVSSLSSHTQLSLVNISNTSADSELSPLLDPKPSIILCHLNVQSLMPKMEEVRALLSVQSAL